MLDLICPFCRNVLVLVRLYATKSCPGCGHSFATNFGDVLDFRTQLVDSSTTWAAGRFDAAYQKVGKFIDGYEHARRGGIPDFVEDYRIDRVKDEISRRLVKKQAGRLLDLGCGNGWFDFRLREKWNFSGEIVGIDISPFQVDLFRAETRRAGQTRMDAFCANGEALPFPDDYFDHVIITEVLEHVASPGKTLAEVARVLKRGGEIFLTTPSGPLCRFWKFLVWPAQKVRRLFIPSKTKKEEQIYDVPRSKKQISRMIENADLRMVHYHKAVYLPHESYLQFIPVSILRIMVVAARMLESLGSLSMFLGLHHIMVLRQRKGS